MSVVPFGILIGVVALLVRQHAVLRSWSLTLTLIVLFVGVFTNASNITALGASLNKLSARLLDLAMKR